MIKALAALLLFIAISSIAWGTPTSGRRPYRTRYKVPLPRIEALMESFPGAFDPHSQEHQLYPTLKPQFIGLTSSRRRMQITAAKDPRVDSRIGFEINVDYEFTAATNQLKIFNVEFGHRVRPEYGWRVAVAELVIMHPSVHHLIVEPGGNRLRSTVTFCEEGLSAGTEEREIARGLPMTKAMAQLQFALTYVRIVRAPPNDPAGVNLTLEYGNVPIFRARSNQI